MQQDDVKLKKNSYQFEWNNSSFNVYLCLLKVIWGIINGSFCSYKVK